MRLVISATTPRDHVPDVLPDLSSLWQPCFPSPVNVRAAAGRYRARELWNGSEGPRPRIVIGPGVVALEAPDLARRERTAERECERARMRADLEAAYYLEHGELPPEPEPVREITGWSRRSRSCMVRRLAELDWTPLVSAGRLPAMVTLTLPGEWESVAPDGRSWKRLVEAFKVRYERAWGEPLAGAWKLEFQSRGAPHQHIFMTPPTGRAGGHHRRPAVGDGLQFRKWLSVVWADVVNHPDPEQRRRHVLAGTGVDFAEGMRSADSKRLACYFTKHGAFSAKEYQNCVPEPWQAPGRGPGRFWGYWGLKRTVAIVELTPVDWVAVARTLRRYVRAQDVRARIRAPRTKGGRARPTDVVVGLSGALLLEARPPPGSRFVRRRVKRFSRGLGFLCVNDGPALAAMLAR